LQIRYELFTDGEVFTNLKGCTFKSGALKVFVRDLRLAEVRRVMRHVIARFYQITHYRQTAVANIKLQTKDIMKLI